MQNQKEKNHIVSQVNMALSKAANLNYKVRPYLEKREIETIKRNLVNFVSTNKEVKKVLIENLEEFGQSITDNYVSKLKELAHKKAYIVGQIKIMETTKNKIVFKKLANIEWPYDNTTKNIDAKIAQYKAQFEKIELQERKLSASSPVANEVDLLKFKLMLNEKINAVISANVNMTMAAAV